MENRNFANVPEGTVIRAMGITATVKNVLYSETWHGEYDIEFIDTHGNYRHYKQWDDGGTVTFPKGKKKPLLDCYGTDCRDIFEKYGML